MFLPLDRIHPSRCSSSGPRVPFSDTLVCSTPTCSSAWVCPPVWSEHPLASSDRKLSMRGEPFEWGQEPNQVQIVPQPSPKETPCALLSLVATPTPDPLKVGLRKCALGVASAPSGSCPRYPCCWLAFSDLLALGSLVPTPPPGVFWTLLSALVTHRLPPGCRESVPAQRCQEEASGRLWCNPTAMGWPEQVFPHAPPSGRAGGTGWPCCPPHKAPVLLFPP